MKKIIISCDEDLLFMVLRWLSEKYDVSLAHIAGVLLESDSIPEEVNIDPELIRTFSEVENDFSRDSVIILAHDDPAAVLGNFLNTGFHNIFNFCQKAGTKEPVDRFVLENMHMYVGTYPASTEPTLDYLRYTEETLTTTSIPEHRIFIVNSMPKSGTVWMMAMLEALLEVNVDNRITLSHVNDLRIDWGKFNTHGAVVLVRDLRDVVLSFYHHAARNDIQNGFEQPRYSNIEDFYFNYFLGLIFQNERYCRGDFMSWVNFAASKAIPIIRYEDLLNDTLGSLKKIMNFWKISVEGIKLENVSKKFAFSGMVSMERSGQGKIDEMLSSGHMRKGVSGGWRQELPDRVRHDIEVRFADFQERFSYN